MDVKSYNIQEAAAQLLIPREETSEQDQESMLERESPEKAQEQEVLDDSEELDQGETEDEYQEEPDSDTDDYDSEDDESQEDEDFDDSQEERYTVKVDGEEYEVDLPELIKGYQLEKSVTKKSQQLAEERKQLQDLKAELESQRDNYLSIMQQLAQDSYKELERAKEQLQTIDKEDDPIGFLTKQSEIAEIERNLSTKVQDYQRVQAEQQQEAQRKFAERAQQQDKILAEKLEGWNDPEESKILKESIARYALDTGYTQEELARVVDARDIMVLNKARLYDEQQERRKQVTKKKAPAKPSRKIKASSPAGSSTKRARVVKAKRDRLGSTGKPKDAADLMLELMRKRSR